MPDSISDEEFNDMLEWVNTGVSKGWVCAPICNTHEGLPITEAEEADWEEGYDNCIFAMRLWHG